MQRFGRWARKLEPSGFRFPPCALWVGLAVGCRVAANADLAASPCRDHAAAVRTSVLDESSNSFGDSVCPCRALAGSRRWAIIPSVSGGLGGDVGNARFRKDVTAGETNYSGKLPIILRGPRGCRFRENRVWGRLRCRRLFFSDVSAVGERCRAVPAAASGPERYCSGTTPGTAVVLRFRTLSGHGE